MTRVGAVVLAVFLCGGTAPVQGQGVGSRVQDLGITLEGTPGTLDATTDVPGVAVGHATLIRGSGKLRMGGMGAIAGAGPASEVWEA